ncbi:MAG: UDP-N-acetylglucosamine 1-carboxyvinyltransferase [Candidatus Andersenbacteria bacterium]|nr:UDP-N-acetylglucosamine 1-carboxyvinyltransferase [Candidatus Andersenbacteria bacterium]
MSQFVIQGGRKLSGVIPVYGSKNAALPLLAASLLTEEEVILHNIPEILDVKKMLEIMQAMGVSVISEGNECRIKAEKINEKQVPRDRVGHLRGSVLLLGALLVRCKRVDLPMPGGDVIGARPIEAHLDGLAQLGAKIDVNDSGVSVDGSDMKAGEVVLKEFSVTATENILLAASRLPGKTTIYIAAAEPHVAALAELLNQMGVKVSGAGTHTIIVEGKEELSGAEFTNIQDMLEAGSFILLAAATGSAVTVQNVPLFDLRLFLKKLADIGVDFQIDDHNVMIKPSRLKAFKIQTLPYPGMPTDLQAMFAVVATQAHGASLIHDPMYEGRFKYIDELIKMGANATMCDPHRVIIEGPTRLRGRHIKSLDIRSGVTLILAGLAADGETVIDGAEIIDRGYVNLEERLKDIGADIIRRG